MFNSNITVYRTVCDGRNDSLQYKCFVYAMLFDDNKQNNQDSYQYIAIVDFIQAFMKYDTDRKYASYAFISFWMMFDPKNWAKAIRKLQYKFAKDMLSKKSVLCFEKLNDTSQNLMTIDDIKRAAEFTFCVVLKKPNTTDFYEIAKILSVIYKQYEIAKTVYIHSILRYRLDFERNRFEQCGIIISLFGLSENCYFNKEYLIGTKILKVAFKLGNQFVLINFVNKIYAKQRKKFIRRLKNIKCGYCGRLATKACTGCMKIYYCSKHCQKMDWKNSHYANCVLKNDLFNILYTCCAYHMTLIVI